jgi:ribosome-associated protein
MRGCLAIALLTRGGLIGPTLEAEDAGRRSYGDGTTPGAACRHGARGNVRMRDEKSAREKAFKMIRVNDVVILEREIRERFVRSIGARGQNSRNEATAVELRLDIGASSLPPELKARLRALAGRAVTRDGILVVVSRASRSQADNRRTVRARLAALLQRAATEPKPRRPKKRPLAGLGNTTPRTGLRAAGKR